MNLYLETSAALRDLLDGDDADAIRRALRAADHVVASRLTIAEVERVLVRLRATGAPPPSGFAAREAAFFAEAELWSVRPVDEAVLARCARAFPVEPLRMLDAIHVATVELTSAIIPDVTVLSTDERVRDNAAALGFALAPR